MPHQNQPDWQQDAHVDVATGEHSPSGMSPGQNGALSSTAGERATEVHTRSPGTRRRRRQANRDARTFPRVDTLLNAMPDGVIVVDETGYIRLVNRQAEMLFGYGHEQLNGLPVEALLPQRFHGVHPTHRADYHAQPHMRPMGVGLRLYGLRKDGSEFPVEISLSPIVVADATFVIASIRDVTEQRRLEQVARQDLEGRLTMLRTILDELPVDVYLVRGEDAELVLANRRVAEMWGAEWPVGQTMADFLAASGTCVYDLSGGELAVEQLATVHTLRTGESVRERQEILRHRDGTTLPVMVSAVALDPQVFPYLSGLESHPNGPLPLVLAVHQDMSGLKEAERLKDEFIAMAAHELRNPVAALTGYAQMLVAPVARAEVHHAHKAQAATLDREGWQEEQRMPREWQEEAVMAVVEAARHLTSLTDDLLDATRLHANRLTLRPEPMELVALVRRVVKRAQVATPSDRYSILVAGLPDEPVVVVADAQRIEQVLANLLTNAVKYSPEGGAIEVSLQVIPVASNLDREPAQSHVSRAALRSDAEEGAPLIMGIKPTRQVAQVMVRDHGMGIPAEQHAHIFGRFARADNARQASIPGAGLGLYVCRELVERLGGRIWFESVEKEGTTFTFELPVPEDLLEDDATC